MDRPAAFDLVFGVKGFWLQVVGCGVLGLGFRLWGFGFMALCLGLGIHNALQLVDYPQVSK